MEKISWTDYVKKIKYKKEPCEEECPINNKKKGG